MFAESKIMLHVLYRFEKYEHAFLGACVWPFLINGQFNATESQINAFHYPVGTNVSFSCNSGFRLDGSNFSTCLANGAWSISIPTCTLGNKTNIIGMVSQNNSDNT